METNKDRFHKCFIQILKGIDQYGKKNKFDQINKKKDIGKQLQQY